MGDPTVHFAGAKLLLFIGDRILILRRDHSPGILWPGCLDFPGGGRDGTETPHACAAREALEEVGLIVTPDQMRLAHLHWRYPKCDWFFAVHLPGTAKAQVVFGDEGAGWSLMDPARAASDCQMIPHFGAILAGYLQRIGYEKTGNPKAPGK